MICHPHRYPTSWSLPCRSHPSVSTMPCCSSRTSTGRCASTPTCSAWTSSPTSPAPTPPSCDCPAPGTTTTSACSVSPPPVGRNARRDRPLPPGLAARHHRRARRRPPRPARRRRLHRRVQPRGHQEHLRHRSRRQRVRAAVDAPRDQWGPYENSAPIDHLDLAREVRRWSGVRTAGHVTADPEQGPRPAS